ncbi:MAG TPA: cellulase family glycosylhydrolase [Solirubrobacteraceae bacterium]|nr:cellulase family glycosylhydrolase [Solirubrobacteraceae bacterium]
MSTPHKRQGATGNVALLLTVGALSLLCTNSAAAAQPLARIASSQPVARISRSTLHQAIGERNRAASAVKRDRRALGRCRRVHHGHCAAERRRLRRARSRLARLNSRVEHLRARVASTTGTDSHATVSTGSPSTNFGEPFIKGIDTNLQGWGAEALPTIASEMNTLGVNWAREDLSWSDVESHPGVFDWSSFDQIVYAAQARGITILPIVGYAPSWASPTDATDYAAFVKAAVERYGPGTRANLPWWELWNEPYFSYAWDGKTPEPEAYAHDVVAAAQAAKSVAPSVKLLVAADYTGETQIGSTKTETSWIDDMFSAEPSLGNWVDGVSVHPYGGNPALPLAKPGAFEDTEKEWAFQRIDDIRAKFLAHGVNVPFWITEAGWSNGVLSEATQAQFYANLAPQIAARPWVRALFPYCLREFEASGGKESEFGLLKYGSWEPKPAFFALQKDFATLS